MAEAKKPKKTQYITPEGEVTSAYLNKPSTKYKEDGEYSVKLKFHKKDIAALCSQLQPLLEQAHEEGEAAFAELPAASRKKLGSCTKDDLYTIVYDSEDKETDYVEMSFKSSAVRKDKKTNEKYEVRVPVFSAGKKTPLAKVPNIGKGTTAKASFTVAPYFVSGTGACGLTKYLNAVQILDLIEFGGGTLTSYGFDMEEGYEQEEDDTAEEAVETEEEEAEEPTPEPAKPAEKETKAKAKVTKRSAIDF